MNGQTMPTGWSRLLLAALLATSALCTVPLAPARAQLDDAGVDRVARATVMIVATVVEMTRGIATREHQRVPMGSGIVVSDDGLILTNSHVIDVTALQEAVEAEQNLSGIDLEIAPGFLIYVIDSLDDDLDARYTAEEAADAPEFDLAVLRVTGDEDGRPLRRPVGDDRAPITLAPEDAVTIRESVSILGYPVFGQASAAEIGLTTIDVIDGRVRSLQRAGGLRTIQYIQFDAIVSNGSSGGAVVNEVGELIGVMVEARGGASGGSAAVAIPVDRAVSVLTSVGWRDTRTTLTDDAVQDRQSLIAATFAPGDLVRTTDNVNLREWPTTESATVTELPAGTLLRIGGNSTETSPAWWPVTSDESGLVGFVRGDFLTRAVDGGRAVTSPESLGTGRLAYAAETDGWWQIFVYDFASETRRQVTTARGQDHTAPAWSHDGRRLAFVAGAADVASQVWIANPDGSNVQQLTDYTGPGEITYVEWSADDDALIMTVAGNGVAWLMTTPTNGGYVRSFVSPPASHPAVAGDGEMIFVTVGGQNLDLKLANAQGDVLGDVAASPEWEDAPSVSPDGARVAYQIGDKGARRIGITSLASGATYELPAISNDDSNPVWSPDGQSLALVAHRDGRDTVWVVSADGRQRRQIDLGDAQSLWYLSWTA